MYSETMKYFFEKPIRTSYTTKSKEKNANHYFMILEVNVTQKNGSFPPLKKQKISKKSREKEVELKNLQMENQS